MLSAPTRTAIGLLDVVESPLELGQYIREATAMVRQDSPEASLECSYLDVALGICYGRAHGAFDGHFDAELAWGDIAIRTTGTTPLLCLLASYYSATLRLARLFPADRENLRIVDAPMLVKLYDRFTRLVPRAREVKNYQLAGVCMSLAAECLWRAQGSMVEVISLASRSNMEFLIMDCEATPGARMIARQQVNSTMLACTTVMPPSAPDYLELLYEPGELLTV
jgi:hypothetical protein